VPTQAPAPTATLELSPIPSTATPVPQQQIMVDAPAPGASLPNPFAISGRVALTPQDRQLVYVIRDAAGVIIGSGTIPVQGEPGGPGRFGAELAYLPSLPGPIRTEVIAVDGSAAIEAQIAPVVANLQQGISLDLSGVASQARGQLAPRVAPTRDWIDMSGVPEHLRVLFDDDQPAEGFTPRLRQLLILPVQDYRALFKGEDAELFEQSVQRLREVLATRPITLERELALLPASDQSQAFHAQVRYLDFPSGTGVRYLTYLTQEIEPYNSSKLLYVFQGLTHDGQNLIAAYFPISATLLAPSPDAIEKEERDRFKQDYAAYTAETAAALDSASYETSPALAALDAMLSSLQMSANPLARPEPTAAPAGATLVGSATELLNVRAAPSARAQRIGRLQPNQEVDVLGRDEAAVWLRIRTSAGLTGWVSKDYITTSGDISALPVLE
jgi:hypothetical protein